MVEVLGRAQPAQAMMERAFLLNPHAPAWYFHGAVRVAYFSHDFGRAAELALRAPPTRLLQLIRILAMAQLDRLSEVSAAIEEHRRSFGAAGVQSAVEALPPLLDSLRKAGVTDGGKLRRTDTKL